VFVGAILHNLGNLMTPTTSTHNQTKINSSSAALLTPRTTFVGGSSALEMPLNKRCAATRSASAT
jgi:hypothetical protein